MASSCTMFGSVCLRRCFFNNEFQLILAQIWVKMNNLQQQRSQLLIFAVNEMLLGLYAEFLV